jgi:pSer/pThr/pTyr-binding forkhead associated (FHA) protein
VSDPPLPFWSQFRWQLLGGLLLLFAAITLLVSILVVRNQIAEEKASPKPPASGILEIVSKDGERRSFRVRGPLTTIGRDPSNSLVIEDPQASRRHAEISSGKEGLILRDLGSSNATYVNRRKVHERPLSAGDEITIGSTRIVVCG